MFVLDGLPKDGPNQIFKEPVMTWTKLSQTLIGREVERLFSETSASHGEVCENPVTGGRFVYGIEPIEPQKEAACRALLARVWFSVNGPADAPRLPITHEEGEYLKWRTGRPLDYVVAQYARSLGTHYDVTEHPCLAEFISGLLWDHDNGGSGIPLSAEGLAELKKRFPPRQLEGLSFYSWARPTRKNRKKKSGRLPNRDRRAELSKRSDPTKLHQRGLEHTKPDQDTHKDAELRQTAMVSKALRRAMVLAESFYRPPEN
jgi:hypothetical protein